MSDQYSVSQLCRTLDVSRAGFKAWRDKKPGPRAVETARLDQELQSVFVEKRRAYGSPRLTVEMRQRGWKCGKNRVARRMRENNLAARKRRRYVPRTTQSDPQATAAPNRMAEVAAPTRANQIWVCDITYIATLCGFVYLAAIMDLYSRRIVGWTLSSTMERSLVLNALRAALARRDPAPGCLLHSDRGSQYTSREHRQMLVEHGLEASMSRAGNCYDNAAMESFWSTLKAEGLDQLPSDEKSARMMVFDYIETFYNPARLHSALGYKSPVDFENQMN